MSETVWVNQGRNRSVYHTNEDCERGPRTRELIERSRATLPDDLRECSYCAGTVEGNGGGDLSHYRDLKREAESDD